MFVPSSLPPQEKIIPTHLDSKRFKAQLKDPSEKIKMKKWRFVLLLVTLWMICDELTVVNIQQGNLAAQDISVSEDDTGREYRTVNAGIFAAHRLATCR